MTYNTAAVAPKPTERPIRRLGPLQSLVSYFSFFEVSDPRDAIYSLLVIANDAKPETYLDMGIDQWRTQQSYPRDYGRNYGEVCQVFILFCMQRASPSRALDILCQPWAPDNQSLPSWACQVSGASHGVFTLPGEHSSFLVRRKNADSLVGTSLTNRYPYNASAGTRGLIIIADHPLRVLLDLYVEGFVIDSVAEIASPSQSGNIPSEWLQLAGWSDPENTSPPDELRRTLVADRGEDGQNPPHYFARACQEIVKMGALTSGAISTFELIQSSGSFMVAQFCRRVQAVIWNRALAKTTEGNLALVPRWTKAGDSICILYRCSVPVVLKAQKNDLYYDVSRDVYGWARPIVVEVLKRWIHRRRKTKRTGHQPPIVVEALRRWTTIWRQAKALPVLKPLDAESKDFVTDPSFTTLKRAEYDPGSMDPLPQASSSSSALDEWTKYFYEQALFYQTQVTKKRDPKVFYQLLGECYLHGMMEGQAIALRDKGESQTKERRTQLFELR